MGTSSLNPVDHQRCPKKLRKQNDIRGFEQDENCDERFLKQVEGSNDEGLDDCYKLYLGYLSGCVSESRQPVGDCNEDDEDEGYMDPDYRRVLEKLTVCGKSYALEVHEGAGMLVLVKYEGLDNSDEYWEGGRKLSKGSKDGEEIEGPNDLRNNQSKNNLNKRKSSLLEKVLNRKCLNLESFDGKGCRKLRRVDLDDNQLSEPHGLQTGLGSSQICRKSRNTGEGVKNSVTNQKSGVENNKNVDYKQISRSGGEKEKGNVVPEIELSSERISYPHILQTSRNAPEAEEIGVTTPSKNVETDKNVEIRRNLRSIGSTAEKESRREPRKTENRRILRSSGSMDEKESRPEPRKTETRRILRSDTVNMKETVGEMKVKCEPQFSPLASRKLTDHFRNVGSKRKLDDRRNVRSDLGKEMQDKELSPESIDSVSRGSKHVAEDNDITRSQHKCKTEDFQIDGCYQFFLNGIEKEGHSAVFVHNGNKLRYEEVDFDCASDSEILMWDHDPYLSQDKNNPFVPTEVDASVFQEDNKNEISLFRRKVMNILKRPYSFTEYKDLMIEVKTRKSVKVHREMRVPKSVPVPRLGKSYLDYHPDLKRIIDSDRHNRPRVLNILRGFFFWLENVSYEGKIFKPWLDPSCLAVVPPSKYETC